MEVQVFRHHVESLRTEVSTPGRVETKGARMAGIGVGLKMAHVSSLVDRHGCQAIFRKNSICKRKRQLKNSDFLLCFWIFEFFYN